VRLMNPIRFGAYGSFSGWNDLLDQAKGYAENIAKKSGVKSEAEKVIEGIGAGASKQVVDTLEKRAQAVANEAARKHAQELAKQFAWVKTLGMVVGLAIVGGIAYVVLRPKKGKR
jgi:hypothetical protein